jgi:excisionase family DNA binding protein
MTDKEEMVQQGLVTIEEAMEFLSISRASLYRLINEGAFPTVKLACARRIPRRALIDWVVEHVVRGTNPGREGGGDR